MTITLQELIGAWSLVSAVEVFVDGERRPEFGPQATGYLSYSPDGIVSAVLGSTARPLTGASNPQNATDDDLAAVGRQFIAYAGPFTIDSDADTVTHHIDVALFTDWQGGAQERHVRIDGNQLHITASPRTAPDGRRFHSELTWARSRTAAI